MLSEFIGTHIAKQGITATKAARQCGITPTMMHNLLNTPGMVPRPETMQKLSIGFGIPLHRLYEEAGALPANSGAMGATSPIGRLAEALPIDPEIEAELADLEQDRVRYEAVLTAWLTNLRTLLAMQKAFVS